MKNKLLILAGLFMFFQFGFSLSCFFPHYSIDGSKISYVGLEGNLVLEEVDIETFKTLDEAFAADKNHIYYMGKPVKSIDRETFEATAWYIPVPEDPVWGIGCQTSYITEFKDKNGVYKLEDLKNGKLK